MQVMIMKKIRHYIAGGILLTWVIGTLAHFFYDWSGQNSLAALFFPVNESTWEHMKLIFFPLLLFTLLTWKRASGFSPVLPTALLAGNLTGTLCIPVLFYTYSGIVGKNIPAVDIAVFFISVLIAFWTAWKFRESDFLYRHRTGVWLLCALMAVLFFVFTIAPPELGLFRVP